MINICIFKSFLKSISRDELENGMKNFLYKKQFYKRLTIEIKTLRHKDIKNEN